MDQSTKIDFRMVSLDKQEAEEGSEFPRQCLWP